MAEVKPTLPTIALKVKFEGTLAFDLFGGNIATLSNDLEKLGLQMETISVNEVTIKKNGVLS